MQSRFSKLSRALGVLGFSVLLGNFGWSQNFDIDLNLAAGAGAGVPAAGFSAAAPLSAADIWNDCPIGAAAGIPMVNTAGAATAATWSNSAGFAFQFDGGAIGNDALLLEDLQCGASTITIGGLLPGTYDVYTYAWAPDAPGAFLTNVSVNGGAAQVVGGSAVVPGGSPPPPGTYVTPGHYALHLAVAPVAGAITIAVSVNLSFVSVNGVQLRHNPVTCPPPIILPCQPLPTATQGCNSSASVAGVPSATNPAPVIIHFNGLNVGVNGVVFYGINGPANSVWGPESLLCVKAPVQRLNIVPGASGNTGGTAGNCDGMYWFDITPIIQGGFPGLLGTPMGSGQSVDLQAWQRDPASTKTTTLSVEICMTVCP